MITCGTFRPFGQAVTNFVLFTIVYIQACSAVSNDSTDAL